MQKSFILLLLALSLGACGKSGSSCSDEEATKTILTIIRDAVQNDVVKQLSSGDPNSPNGIGPAAVKSLLDKVKITIEDVRTQSASSNTTQKSCEGKIKLVLPSDLINDANQARSNLGQNSVQQFADMSGLLGGPDAFTHAIAYTVQPTDDGKSLFGETAADTTYISFLRDVITNAVSSGAIERQQQQQTAQAQAEEAQKKVDLDNQRRANLKLAQEQFKLTIQVTNASWQAIDPAVRKQILPLQRAWIAKVKADCHLEAAGVSTDSAEIETARLNCEAKANQSRAEELRQYPQSVDTAAGAAAAARNM